MEGQSDLETTHPLVSRREMVIARVDRVMQAWPERQGEAYVREMQAAVEELEAIASKMRDARLDPVEQGRTQRQLGSLYADLEPALGKHMLEWARAAYALAERLLEGQTDELERAKLDFNYANALRQLDSHDVGQLEEAQRRFLAARASFAAHAPRYLAQTDAGLRSVRALLALAPLQAAVAKNMGDMQALEREMERGGDVTRFAERAREIMQREGGAAGLTARVQGLVEGLPPEQKQGERYAKVQAQLADLTRRVVGAGPANADDAHLLSLMRERLEGDLAAGPLQPDRAETLRGLLDQFGRALSGGEGSQEVMARVHQVRELEEGAIEATHYLTHGVERPPPGSRAGTLVERCWRLRRYLSEEMVRPGKGEDESKEALELSMRAARVDKRIYEAGANDARATIVDKEELRRLALEVRGFSARHQPMIARPLWPVARVPVVTDALFYSGPGDPPPALSRICRRLGFEILLRPRSESYAAARWTQIQKAMTTVYDLRAGNGPALATVAYELGIALTLGKPVVVIGGAEQVLPFDVDVVPVVLTEAPAGDAALEGAIDQSLVWLHSRPPSSSAEVTVQHVLAQYPRPHPNMYVDGTLRMLEELRRRPDPVAEGRVLGQLFDFLNDGHSMLIHPLWPPAYPDGKERRLFHVLPFRMPGADGVTALARRAAQVEQARYIRGDEVKEPNVIRSIWEELARATHTLVDLTGFNPNVALELGIAHTLGRKVLMVCQGSPAASGFPSIGKFRIQGYDADKLDETLGKEVRTFLSPQPQ